MDSDVAGGRKEGVSAQTDALASELVGAALDRLAIGSDVNVLLVVGDDDGVTVGYELSDDGASSLLAGVRDQMARLADEGGDPFRGLAAPVRYAFVYEGAVELPGGPYADALLLEFGEVGYRAYSAYSLYEGKGAGDAFAWSDPAPAGEVEPLL